MCEYCEGNETIIEKEFLDSWVLGWNDAPITNKNAMYSTYKIFVDRGFLRFVPQDDTQCLDHGEKFRIKFCPMCGIGLEGE